MPKKKSDAPPTRTARLPTDLLDRADQVREKIQRKAGVEVDLSAVLARAVADGLDAAERRLERS